MLVSSVGISDQESLHNMNGGGKIVQPPSRKQRAQTASIASVALTVKLT